MVYNEMNGMKFEVAGMLKRHYLLLGRMGDFFYWGKRMSELSKDDGDFLFSLLQNLEYHRFHKFNNELLVKFLKQENEMLINHIESSPDGKLFMEARDEWLNCNLLIS